MEARRSEKGERGVPRRKSIVVYIRPTPPILIQLETAASFREFHLNNSIASWRVPSLFRLDPRLDRPRDWSPSSLPRISLVHRPAKDTWPDVYYLPSVSARRWIIPSRLVPQRSSFDRSFVRFYAPSWLCRAAKVRARNSRPFFNPIAN